MRLPPFSILLGDLLVVNKLTRLFLPVTPFEGDVFSFFLEFIIFLLSFFSILFRDLIFVLESTAFLTVFVSYGARILHESAILVMSTSMLLLLMIVSMELRCI